MYNPELIVWVLLGVNLFFAFSMIRIIIKRHQPGPKLFRESNRFYMLMKWYDVSEKAALEEFAKIPSLIALKARNDEMEKEIQKYTKEFMTDCKKKIKYAKRNRSNNKSK